MKWIFALVAAWRDLPAMLAAPALPASAVGLGAAIDEAVMRFPDDRIVRKAKALAEIEVRELVGLRRYDA